MRNLIPVVSYNHGPTLEDIDEVLAEVNELLRPWSIVVRTAQRPGDGRWEMVARGPGPEDTEPDDEASIDKTTVSRPEGEESEWTGETDAYGKNIYVGDVVVKCWGCGWGARHCVFRAHRIIKHRLAETPGYRYVLGVSDEDFVYNRWRGSEVRLIDNLEWDFPLGADLYIDENEIKDPTLSPTRYDLTKLSLPSE